MTHYDWNPLYWDILPNYRLIQSRRTFDDISEGDFGLLRGDEIVAYIKGEFTPYPNPLFEIEFGDEIPSVKFLKRFFPDHSNEQLDEWLFLQEQWYQDAQNFNDNFPKLALDVSHDLVENLKIAGYDPEIHKNNPYYFLFNLIGDFLSWNSGYYDIRINAKFKEI
jgi:hypothetical protein